MVNVNVKNIKGLEYFLTVINKFAPQCLFNISKERTEIFCKNSVDFASSRFDAISDLLTIDEKCKYDKIMLCIRDINALKSALNLVDIVEPDKTSLTLNIEEIITPEQEVYGRKISYKGKAKFGLITVDRDVIESFVGQAIKSDIDADMIWRFNIDPVMLDTVQNRTNTIVNTDTEVSIYLAPNKDGGVDCSLLAKKSTYNNEVVIPIADKYEGSLDNVKVEICISDSSFRIANILKVTNSNNLICSFNDRYNFLKFDSFIKEDNYYIKSTVITGIVKGK